MKHLLWISGICLLALLAGCGRSDQKEDAGSDDTGAAMAANIDGDLHKIDVPADETKDAEYTQNPDGQETSEAGDGVEHVMHTLLISTGPSGGNPLFVDTETQAVFTAPIASDLTDGDGHPVSADALSPGNRIDIYGNGIMLETYPGQYPGVTKMVLTDVGDPTDADAYSDVAAMVSPASDGDELPNLNVSYSTELAKVTAVLTRGNYSWAFSTEGDNPEEAVACGKHFLQWDDVVDLDVDGLTDMTLASGTAPNTVNVYRWPADAYDPNGTETIDVDAETIETVTDEDGNIVIPDVEADYLYGLEATWDNGTVEYAFLTKASK